MKEQIEIRVLRPAPVLRLARLAQLSAHDLLQLTRRPVVMRRMEYTLPPFFFARTRTKALVFTSPYKTLLERLEVIGESKRMFNDIPVTFDSAGMPLVTAKPGNLASVTEPSPQLLLRLAE